MSKPNTGGTPPALLKLAAPGFEWFGYMGVPHHAVPEGSYLATDPANAEIIAATWNGFADLVRQSYGEAKLMLDTLEGYEKEASQRLDRFSKDEWPWRYILAALQEQVNLHGRDASVKSFPPPELEPKSFKQGGWMTFYGARNAEEPFDEATAWESDGFSYRAPEFAGEVPHRLETLARVYVRQTWGEARDRAFEHYRLEEQEREQWATYAEVLRFRIAVLRNVLRQYEVYGWTYRWGPEQPKGRPVTNPDRARFQALRKVLALPAAKENPSGMMSLALGELADFAGAEDALNSFRSYIALTLKRWGIPLQRAGGRDKLGQRRRAELLAVIVEAWCKADDEKRPREAAAKEAARQWFEKRSGEDGKGDEV